MEWLGINKWWASCCCFLYWFALRLRYATVLFCLVNATTWYDYHYSGERTVLLLTIHFLPDMQAAKSTLTIQIFHVFHYRSANSEPQPHTSADKCLRTPRKVVAKSSLHSISLTLAWLPVRHFNLISFPKLNAVLIVKGSRSCERCVHMCRHTHTRTCLQRHTPPHAEARSATVWSSRDPGLTSTQRPTHRGVSKASPSNGPPLIMSSIRDQMTGRYSINGHWNAAQGLWAIPVILGRQQDMHINAWDQGYDTCMQLLQDTKESLLLRSLVNTCPIDRSSSILVLQCLSS